eukprot:TRINITY_DN3489_c0_g1_i2.p2 TRINITY_DN3489_c0_g1~~TRINITY_DN3489_c0_g1_i2.p2  ORF type:complete len:252 (-),score=15.40 TRINITY_DN3489_c0_g1_i2:97-852(-)
MERRRPKRQLNWSSYNLKVLQQDLVHGANHLSLSTKAMTVVNDMLWDLYHRIMSESENLLALSKKNVITADCIQTAVRLITPGELALHAVSKARKSVTKGCGCGFLDDPHTHRAAPRKSSTDKSVDPKQPRQSISSRVGLAFPVGRILKKMRKDTKYRVNTTAGTYFTAVIEYISSEILELAGNMARDNRKKRIIPRHVLLAIRTDTELDKLYGDSLIAFAGVMPIITVTILGPKIKIANNSNNEQTPQSN